MPPAGGQEVQTHLVIVMALAFSSMGRFILYCGRQAMGVSKGVSLP